MTQIVTRISPSPTGNGIASSCHAGLARTAMFNWAWARRNNGKFLLRIEDTDQKRSTKESEQGIINDLTWLGIEWDEGPDKPGSNGPYRQSERLDIYNKFIDQLLDNGSAYKDEDCVRIKFKHYGETHCDVDDMILGKVSYPNDRLSDFVIRKSDGFPTYHFAVVVDDALMGVNHIFRAQEHLANTPKHILIYKALGFDIPNYGHMPIILNQDGSKMSKRQHSDDINIGDFKKSGYLPDALLNYLSLLGWAPKEKIEIFDRKYLIENFDIHNVRKSNAKFDYKKLQNINGKHLAQLDRTEFIKRAHNHINTNGMKTDHDISHFYQKAYTFQQIISSIELLDESLKNIKQININNDMSVCFKNIYNNLSNQNNWNSSLIVETIKKSSEETNVSIGSVYKSFKEIFPSLEKNITIDVLLSSIGKTQGLKLLMSFTKD